MKKGLQFLLLFLICLACQPNQPEEETKEDLIEEEPSVAPRKNDSLNNNPGTNHPNQNKSPNISTKKNVNTGSNPSSKIDSPTSSLPFIDTSQKVAPPLPSPPVINTPLPPNVVLKELTEEDRDQLIQSFVIEPNTAYVGQKTVFRILTKERGKWYWDWDLNGDGEWDPIKERNDIYTYNSPGKVAVQLRARSKNIFVPFEHKIIVTVSHDFLESLFADLIPLSKKADETESTTDIEALEKKLREIQKFAEGNVLIKVPDEAGYISFEDFQNIVYADLPYEIVYSGLDDFEFNENGMVTSITLK